MTQGKEARRRVYADKAAAEFAELEGLGVSMGGNAFSSVLLLKGSAFGAQDLGALLASLKALGYAPEDWASLVTVRADAADVDAAADGTADAPTGEKPLPPADVPVPGEPLDPAVLRLAVTTLDPATLVCCDDAAADAVREAYADDLAILEDLQEALLAPGVVAHVAGMRVLALGGFEAALGDPRQKQLMWARLKLVPPLGEPI